MKKVINGRLYDTDTAKEIGYRCSNITDQLEGIQETLYRKRTGEFFLHGDGGARTQYAHQTEGGGWCGGEGIVPLSYDRAREWAEEYLDADEYLKYFSLEEDGNDAEKINASFYLSKSVVNMARRKSSEAGMSISGWIEKLILDA